MKEISYGHVDAICAEIERAQDAREQARRRESAEIGHSRAAVCWRDGRAQRAAAGRAVFEWLRALDRAGIRKRISDVAGERLRVWGPMAKSGVETCGGSGSYWIEILLTGRVGVVVRWHAMAGVGVERVYRDPEALGDGLPAELLALVEGEVKSGRAEDGVIKRLEHLLAEAAPGS